MMISIILDGNHSAVLVYKGPSIYEQTDASKVLINAGSTLGCTMTRVKGQVGYHSHISDQFSFELGITNCMFQAHDWVSSLGIAPWLATFSFR